MMLMMNELRKVFVGCILYFAFGFGNCFSDSCVGNLPTLPKQGWTNWALIF